MPMPKPLGKRRSLNRCLGMKCCVKYLEGMSHCKLGSGFLSDFCMGVRRVSDYQYVCTFIFLTGLFSVREGIHCKQVVVRLLYLRLASTS